MNKIGIKESMLMLKWFFKKAGREAFPFSEMPYDECRRDAEIFKIHHLATTIVITDSATNRQCMLKLVGENLMRNGLFK